LWQEGHTIHATAEEAEAETLQMLDVYREFAEGVMAVPVYVGRKSDKEKFAGARATYSMEAMMQDGKALQAGTSHNFGTNFAEAFNIQYLSKDGKLEYVHETSWGTSTRMVGAIIMTHGDERGLKLPPKLAPIQVVIVPISKTDEERAGVMPAAEDIFKKLQAAGVRVKLDSREGFTPGWKFNDWEMRGVPIRMEIGPKDVANKSVVLARRDIPGRDGKTFVPWEGLENAVADLLVTIQQAMLEKARAFRDANTHQPETYDDLKTVVEDGFALAWWCGSAECEEQIKADTKATNRCIPMDQPGGTGKCVCCGKEAHEKAIFGKAY
jgi:prolyl-tRNA synthetase